MEPHLILRPIDADQVLQAYPLVQAIEPQLTLERWQALARDLIDRLSLPGACGGIMSLQSAKGYIHGLFVYDVADDPRCGRTLRVETVVAFHLGAAADAARRMIRAIEAVAQQSGCTTVQVALPVEGGACPHRPGVVLSGLEQAGYRPASITWCKRSLVADSSPDNRYNP